MKTLDMADKYEPLSYEDDEDTIRIQVPTFHPQVVIGGPENDDFDLHGERDTIPCPPPAHLLQESKRYPGVGLLICLVTGLAFWGTVAYFIFR